MYALNKENGKTRPKRAYFFEKKSAVGENLILSCSAKECFPSSFFCRYQKISPLAGRA
jgi:hypothetical protein